MKVQVELDESYKEPTIVIKTDKITEEVNNIVQQLTQQEQGLIAGFTDVSRRYVTRLKNMIGL